MLKTLRSLDVHSLMVEGGASVIGSFLAEASSSLKTANDGEAKSIVDMVIVTVAPTLVGDDGVGYGVGLAGNEVG